MSSSLAVMRIPSRPSEGPSHPPLAAVSPMQQHWPRLARPWHLASGFLLASCVGAPSCYTGLFWQIKY